MPVPSRSVVTPFPFRGIGPDGKARMAGRAAARRLGRSHRHAGIDREQAALVGQHGVEIELSHFGQIGGQLRELDQQ